MAILFNIEHYVGAKIYFYIAEVALVFSLPIIYLIKKEINNKMKSLLYRRTIVLFVLNIIAIFL
jgi:hypothetical protein